MYPCANLVSCNYTSDKKTKYNKNKTCDTVFVFFISLEYLLHRKIVSIFKPKKKREKL